jgi:hypothetical protein
MVLKEKNFVFEDADKSFDLLFSSIKTGRSLAASYSLQSDIQRRCPNLLRTHARVDVHPSSVHPGAIGTRSQIV